MTKNLLGAHGIEFVEEDITDPGNLAAAKSLGFLAAPVVTVGDSADDMWSGFQPERIKEIAARTHRRGGSCPKPFDSSEQLTVPDGDEREAVEAEATRRWGEFASTDTRQGAFERDAFVEGAMWALSRAAAPETEWDLAVLGKEDANDPEGDWQLTLWKPLEIGKARSEFPGSAYRLCRIEPLPVGGETE